LPEGYWVGDSSEDPESWTKIAGNYGPVTVVHYMGERVSDNRLVTTATKWHEARFPNATSVDLLGKAMEELGEVAEALTIDEGRNSAKSYKGDSVVKESADVIVCLLALCGRYYGQDVISEVIAKLEMLNTPGAHRASIPG
jgi:NTP pyrophosphatase (non-canonical NTP hydrolase)